jgi:CDP-paratose 2-epimerase
VAFVGKRLLITGGAGFIGASLAVELATRHSDWEITALDNLHRRGSELNIARLREAGVGFVHGDVREPDDLRAAGPFDALLECSAEPSVMAGLDGATGFLVRTNLLGAYHCLEVAAEHGAQVVFLSTSRVYPVAALNALAYEEQPTRFALSDGQSLPGASSQGIGEQFPLDGARTLYGATKLAAELLIAEYAETFGLRAVVNRCGVVAGPWQMGKVDQGVFTHWMLAFYFKRAIAYLGFGGAGKQVRDLLHVADLAELIDDQLQRPEHWAGAVVNVGGGVAANLSLRETTELCAEITGNAVELGSDPETRAGDVRIYVSDCRALAAYSDWAPQHSPGQIMSDIYSWIHDHERLVASALQGA